MSLRLLRDFCLFTLIVVVIVCVVAPVVLLLLLFFLFKEHYFNINFKLQFSLVSFVIVPGMSC